MHHLMLVSQRFVNLESECVEPALIDFWLLEQLPILYIQLIQSSICFECPILLYLGLHQLLRNVIWIFNCSMFPFPASLVQQENVPQNQK